MQSIVARANTCSFPYLPHGLSFAIQVPIGSGALRPRPLLLLIKVSKHRIPQFVVCLVHIATGAIPFSRVTLEESQRTFKKPLPLLGILGSGDSARPSERSSSLQMIRENCQEFPHHWALSRELTGRWASVGGTLFSFSFSVPILPR